MAINEFEQKFSEAKNLYANGSYAEAVETVLDLYLCLGDKSSEYAARCEWQIGKSLFGSGETSRSLYFLNRACRNFEKMGRSSEAELVAADVEVIECWRVDEEK